GHSNFRQGGLFLSAPPIFIEKVLNCFQEQVSQGLIVIQSKVFEFLDDSGVYSECHSFFFHEVLNTT
ncbi:MAG: hypothetical protein MUO52_13900, partial [Desulfobacterales bacterium]|nr:hypothetical protein [Desulfobacterales bacterium]